MRLPNAFRTAAFRLTSVYAVLFVISLAAILTILVREVDQSMRNQLRAAVREDALLLSRSPNLGHSPDSQVRKRQDSQLIYYYVRLGDGTPALADFRLPREIEGRFEAAASHVQPQVEREPGSHLIGYGIRLKDGSYVAAARDDYAIQETKEAVYEAATTAALVALALALLGGLLMSALSLRRVNSLDRTARAIFDGDLSRRMPVGGTGDEYDRLAASLNRMLDQISLLMASLRQVSTDVAHDLRTPLGRLRQRLEDVERAGLTTEQRLALEAAITEADKVLSIFGALIQIAQVEAGTLRTRFMNIDLGALALEVGEVYEVVAEGAGHVLNLDAAVSAVVLGNRELLAQMIVNLLENAITHTPPGTSVQLSIGRSAGKVVLTVADDGDGIPPEEMDRVFRRFYRLDRSRSTPGTGLGLALVAAIADLHGVVIELSDNGPGLRIELNFPEVASAPRDG